MKNTRVAIIGAGFIAAFHLRALRELRTVEITGICDVNLARARKLRDTAGTGGAYASVEELAAESKPDVVHIVTPPTDHKNTVVRCLQLGLAIFTEKPAASTTEECRALLKLQTETGGYIGTNHNAVFHPAFRRATQWIREGKIGGVEHISACLNAPLRQLSAGQHSHWMFASPVNILLEQGPHPLSQICFLAGKPLQVAALRSGERALNTGGSFYDSWQVAIECERATAQCFFSFGKSFPEWWIYIVGQDGSLFVDLRRNNVRLCGKSRFVEPADHLRIAVSTGTSIIKQGLQTFIDYGVSFLNVRPSRDPFYASMRDSIHEFHKAFRDRTTPPVTFGQGCEIVTLCEEIADAAMERMVPVHAGS